MQFDVINSRGEIMPLIGNDLFYLEDIDGLTNANISLSTNSVGNIDGDEITNEKAEPRTLILDLRIKSGVNVEAAKRAITSVIKLKRNITIEWTQNARKTRINGVVEALEMPRFNNTVTMQITLHCSQPFWEDVIAIIQNINEALPLHYFTTYNDDMLFFPETGIAFGEYDKSRMRKINNGGDVAIGLQIEILAYDTVTNPIINGENGEFFGVGYGTGNKRVVMQAGDLIKINTVKGEKSVTLNGVSLLDKIKPLSTWLQLEAGENIFAVNSDDEANDNMTFSLSFKQRYI